MRRIIRRLLGLPGNRRGNAMLEFAIGSGVLVSIFTGTFQFGYTFYQYNLLLNAVNDGARYAALRPYDSTTSTPSTAFSNAVKNMVVYGNPTGGSAPVVPNLATSNVNITVGFLNSVPRTMAVSISGYTINSVFSSTTYTGKPRVTYSYQGEFSPY